MTIFEQKEVLKSFEILCDSREQDTERARKRYASFGGPYKNKITLSYGDYAYNAILPDGIIPVLGFCGHGCVDQIFGRRCGMIRGGFP